MTGVYATSGHRHRWQDRAYWLPPGGFDNGLDAETWVVLADTDSSQLPLLLARLMLAGIAAYAAPTGRLGRRTRPSTFRIWVDTWLHAQAEDIVRTISREPPPAMP
jgi:hypothetical protein